MEKTANRFWKACVWIFLAAFAVRSLVTILFMATFGTHAVRHTETWFYMGVMSHRLQSYLAGQSLDVTGWILGGVGSLLPERYHLLGVESLGVLLSCLTACAVYALFRKLHDEKAGFAAGIFYATMANPLLLSATGFTHDLVQLPILLMSLFLGVSYLVSRKPHLLAAYALTLAVGYFINLTILVSPFIVGIHAIYLALRRGRVSDVGRLNQVFALSAALAFVVLAYTIVPLVFDAILGSLPQGSSGSSDVTPASLGSVWLHYNVLFILVPYGVYRAVRRGEFISLSLVFSGLILSTQMIRALRISDIGFAAIAAYAVADWHAKDGSGLFGQKRRNDMALYCLIAVFGCVLLLGTGRMEYNIMFLSAGILTVYLLGLGGSGHKWVLATFAVSTLFFSALNTLSLDSREITTEAEYEVLEYLSRENEGGKILVGWDKGYMVEAISGLKSVSSPNSIRYEIHDLLWLPTDESSLMLSKKNVSYVLVTSDNFEVIELDGKVAYGMEGELVRAPTHKLKPELRENYTIYKLRYTGGDQHYKLVGNEVDKATGAKVMLYKVAAK